MPDDPTGHAGPHPDLRRICLEAIRDLAEQGAPVPEIDIEQLRIRCQRTWHGIESSSPEIDGASLSACVVQFQHEEDYYSYFVTALRPTGEDDWEWSGISGGQIAESALDEAGGFTISGGAYVCVGGLLPDEREPPDFRSDPIGWLDARLRGRHGPIAAIQVEHADGSIYESPAVDGCAIVFAPVTSEPTPEDTATIRHLDATRQPISTTQFWIGDGGPPPQLREREG